MPASLSIHCHLIAGNTNSPVSSHMPWNPVSSQIPESFVRWLLRRKTRIRRWVPRCHKIQRVRKYLRLLYDGCFVRKHEFDDEFLDQKLVGSSISRGRSRSTSGSRSSGGLLRFCKSDSNVIGVRYCFYWFLVDCNFLGFWFPNLSLSLHADRTMDSTFINVLERIGTVSLLISWYVVDSVYGVWIFWGGFVSIDK